MEEGSASEACSRAMRALETCVWNAPGEGYAALEREAEAWKFQVMKRTTKKNAMYLHCARCNKELRDREMMASDPLQGTSKRPKYPRQYTGWRAKLSEDSAKQWTLEILHEGHAHHSVARAHSIVDMGDLGSSGRNEGGEVDANEVGTVGDVPAILKTQFRNLNATAAVLARGHPDKLEDLVLDVASIVEKYQAWGRDESAHLELEQQPLSKRRR